VCVCVYGLLLTASHSGMMLAKYQVIYVRHEVPIILDSLLFSNNLSMPKGLTRPRETSEQFFCKSYLDVIFVLCFGYVSEQLHFKFT